MGMDDLYEMTQKKQGGATKQGGISSLHTTVSAEFPAMQATA